MALFLRNTGEHHGKLDIFHRAEHRDQVIGLKDESDLMQAQLTQRITLQAADVGIFQQHPALGRFIQGADQVQQGGLSGAGGTGNYRKLSLLDRKVDAPQCMHRHAVILIGLFQVDGLNNAHS